MSIDNRQNLQRYVQPQVISTKFTDVNIPLSYQEWVKTHQGITPGQEYNLYNDYLVNWHEQEQEKYNTSINNLKIQYLKLLKQLQLFFSKEEIENWYNGIDINSEKEVLLAIPYFSRKLKEIVLYYSKTRKDIQNTKFKSNLKGTGANITKQVQDLLLTTYTKEANKPITIPASIFKNVPELSSVQEELTIEIEELYDLTNYQDHSPTASVSLYYNLSGDSIKQYFESFGLTLTSDEWVFKTGVFDPNDQTLSAIVSTVNEADISNKEILQYLGSPKYSFNPQVAISSIKTDPYEIQIEQGNNFWYWPSGVYKSNIYRLPLYNSVSLNELSLKDFGTAGVTIETSDTIFVKSKNNFEGAWLRLQQYDTTPETLKATLVANEKTIFRFPYPGYGISAEDIPWTGYGLVTDPRFFFLGEEAKKAIETEYWSTPFDNIKVDDLYLNTTNLVEQKAHPSENYFNADKVRIWPFSPVYNLESFSGELQEAWLYKLQKTSLSIGRDTFNRILWPYLNLEFETNLYRDYARNTLPKTLPQPIATACLPTSLSSIPLTFNIASNSLSSADVIFKLQNFTDSTALATDCAWLSGKTVEYYNPITGFITTTIKQPGLYGIFQPGKFTKFFWQGPNNTNCNTVFASLSHQPDCTYITASANIDNFNLCNCQRIQYTPFGHSGSNIGDNNFHTDLIIEDIKPNNNFNINTWFDMSGNNVFNSPQVAWFKTNSVTGWGNGEWTSTKNTPFFLQKGRSYIYYRANTRTLNPNISSFPELVTRHTYTDLNEGDFIWMTGILNNENKWISTNTPATVTNLHPGDYVVYYRQPLTTQFLSGGLSGSYVEEIKTFSQNKGSIWSLYDYYAIDEKGAQVDVTYPFQSYLNVTSPICPPCTLSALSASCLQYYGTSSQFCTISSLQTIFSFITSYCLSCSIFSYFDYLNGQLPVPSYPIVNVPPTVDWRTAGINKQLPGFPYGDLRQVIYHVKTPDNRILEFRNIPAFSFNVLLTGIYTITMTAVTGLNTAVYTNPNRWPIDINASGAGLGAGIFRNIPSITAYPAQVVQTSVLTGFNTPAPGFVLSTPLYGWDYNTSTYSNDKSLESQGARPYWATTYVEKTPETRFKSIEAWGNNPKTLDKYNIVTQPDISELLLNAGSYFEYERKYSTDIIWTQPVVINFEVNRKIWSKINIETDSLNTIDQFNSVKSGLVSLPTTTPSPIVLQTLIDNEPVEIHYNAIKPLIWNFEVTSVTEETIFTSPTATPIVNPETIDGPWRNLLNRFYPNVAVFPTNEKMVDTKTIGGFFQGGNTGVTQYIDRFYTTTLSVTSKVLSGSYENPNEYVGGRGLTKQDQFTPYEVVLENNEWLKNINLNTPIAGTIKKDLFKKHQKFIPYQSLYESNSRSRLGLLTPVSRQTPWTGPKDTTWGDKENYPVSFTGELNIDLWSQKQILKNTNLLLDRWCTDIFGNQYGLYKDMQHVSPNERKNTPGEIWIRKNTQKVSTGNNFLSGVFDSYSNTLFYSDLTGRGVYNIDIFFDTLYIQTSSGIFFEKIIYDYNKDEIYSVIDDARHISLSIPTVNNLNREFSNTITNSLTCAKAGELWFLPEQKYVIQSVCALSGTTLLPELYLYDINKTLLTKVFPVFEDDFTSLNDLQNLNIISFDTPVISYNSLKKEFVLTVLAQKQDNSNVLIELKINNFSKLKLKTLTIYDSSPPNTILIPPGIHTPLYIQIGYPTFLTYLLSSTPAFDSVEPINWPAWANVTQNGVIYGQPPSPGTFPLTFALRNTFGPVYHTLTVSVTASNNTSNLFILEETDPLLPPVSIASESEEYLVTD